MELIKVQYMGAVDENGRIPGHEWLGKVQSIDPQEIDSYIEDKFRKLLVVIVPYGESDWEKQENQYRKIFDDLRRDLIDKIRSTYG